MKKPVMRTILIFLITSCILQIHLVAQDDPNTLLNKSFIDRPLNMYKGQLQMNTGYGLHYSTFYFNQDGSTLRLDEEGRSLLTHQFTLEVRYGIFNFLEISFNTNYLSRNERIRMVLKAGIDNLISYGGNMDTKGLEDADLNLAFTLPNMPEYLQFNLLAGLQFPVGGNDPEQPEHVLTYPYSFPGAYDIQFQFLNRPGDGVIRSAVGLGLKSVLGKIAFTGLVNYSFPLAEGVGLKWYSRLTGDTFEYERENFNYLSQKYLDFSLAGIFQAFPWFAVEAGIEGYFTNGGWQEIAELKYALPEIQSIYASAGFEIMVTPNIRVFQSFALPLKGSNTPAGISIFSNLSFNLFPFKN
jgi:hypothetical protein